MKEERRTGKCNRSKSSTQWDKTFKEKLTLNGIKTVIPSPCKVPSTKGKEAWQSPTWEEEHGLIGSDFPEQTQF